MKRFAIIGLARSGSSYLVSMLDSHPEIHCCGEIFNRDGVNLRWPKTLGGRQAGRAIESELEELRARDPQAFLERVFAIDFGKPVLGFKIFRNHNPPMLERIIADRDIAKIVLRRANGLARYASAVARRLAGEGGRLQTHEAGKQRQMVGEAMVRLVGVRGRSIVLKPHLSRSPTQAQWPGLRPYRRARQGPWTVAEFL